MGFSMDASYEFEVSSFTCSVLKGGSQKMGRSLAMPTFSIPISKQEAQLLLGDRATRKHAKDS